MKVKTYIFLRDFLDYLSVLFWILACVFCVLIVIGSLINLKTAYFFIVATALSCLLSILFAYLQKYVETNYRNVLSEYIDSLCKAK